MLETVIHYNTEDMPMSMKIYAVRKGLTPGIYKSWEECKAQVSGYSGAEYKSFSKMEEAQAYLSGSSLPSSGREDHLALPADEAVAYVDGSYRDDTSEFSYGAVIFHKGQEIRLSDKSSDPALADMRNVAGEIKGAEASMRYAINNGIKRLTIYHDYEGIAKWCTGDWKANKEGTISYREFYRSISASVDITFQKVKGHSGVTFNELADQLAKEALGIK